MHMPFDNTVQFSQGVNATVHGVDRLHLSLLFQKKIRPSQAPALESIDTAASIQLQQQNITHGRMYRMIHHLTLHIQDAHVSHPLPV
jgi:hypothetical protein